MENEPISEAGKQDFRPLAKHNLALVKMVEVAMASSDVAARNQGSQRRHRSAVWSRTTEPLSLGFAAQHREASGAKTPKVYGGPRA